VSAIKGYIDVKELYLQYKFYCLQVNKIINFGQYAYYYIKILNERGFMLALNNRSFSVMI